MLNETFETGNGDLGCSLLRLRKITPWVESSKNLPIQYNMLVSVDSRSPEATLGSLLSLPWDVV